MSRLLIVYGTTEGHTRKIAEHIAGVVRRLGHDAEVLDSAAKDAAQTERRYDAVILGGSLHEGRHQGALTHFIKSNLEWLNSVPSAFFSVSLTIASGDVHDRSEAGYVAQRYLDEVGWQPARTQCVAGALLYTRYSFLKRFLMRLIAQRAGGATDTSRDYEYTDWDEVTRFVEAFVSDCVPASALA